VAGQCDKALHFWELIGERPGFECPYRPESNILCFRFGRDSDLQVAIRDRLIASGEFHLSSVELDGERYLRMVVMNPATDEATIERLLGAIETAARG
jgi:L-2,4-diaminobutyrate decarboxylase